MKVPMHQKQYTDQLTSSGIFPALVNFVLKNPNLFKVIHDSDSL
jgi:hypothetical protein